MRIDYRILALNSPEKPLSSPRKTPKLSTVKDDRPGASGRYLKYYFLALGIACLCLFSAED
jgi:hypothetical protein